MHASKDRYSRQVLLINIKEEGQEKLAKSSITIIGCGALGTTIANNLVRSGIGQIKIVDRDIVELNNLQRQNLFDEEDIGLPKALVATKKLERINSDVTIDSVVDDVNHTNIENIIKNSDIVLGSIILLRLIGMDLSLLVVQPGKKNMISEILWNSLSKKFGTEKNFN